MGPCPIFAVDPYSGAWTNEFSAGTEDIYEFKEFSDGRLYASAVDPNEKSANFGSTFRRGHDGVWQAFATACTQARCHLDPSTDGGDHQGYMIHNWDMAEWNGYTFVCGYGISGSTDWCETPMFDATPQLRYITRTLWEGATIHRRFTTFLPFEDDIYCIPTQPTWNGEYLDYCDWEEWRWVESDQMFVCQTNTWGNIAPDVTAASASLTQFPSNGGNKTLQLWHPTKFKGRILYVLAEAYPLVPWAAFSATNENHHVKAVKIDLGGDDVKPFDICVAGDAAYLVAGQAGNTATAVTNSVWKSTDGVSFTKLFSFVSSRAAMAICYLDGCFYLGMGGARDTNKGWPNVTGQELSGNIYRVKLPQGSAPLVEAETASAYILEGDSVNVSFRLAAAPATNMTLRVWATNPKLALSASTLSFTPSNWNVAQAVRVSVPEDDTEDAVDGAVVCGTGGADCISGFTQVEMIDNDGDLTTAISGGVTATSSYWDYNLQAEHAFDGNRSEGIGRWLARRKDHMYVVYKFNEATAVNVLRVWNASDTYGGYDSAGRSPKDWTFQGSDDGVNWTTLDTRTGESGWSSTGEMREYSFTNGTAYTYYKYDCTALNDEVSISKNSDTQEPEAQVLQLWELEFLYKQEYDPTQAQDPDPDPALDGPGDFFVATTGNDANDGTRAAPFATIGAAITAANAAIDGLTTNVAIIHVAAGTYTGAGYVLDRAVTVVGAGAGSTVIDGNGGYRLFSLISSGAALKNLCISNAAFTAAQDTGAGIYMTAGLVEDCAITSCGSFSGSKTSGGGVYASGGRISRSVFTGCKVHTRWSGDVGYGSALYLSNGAVCENSLFTGNVAASCFDWNDTNRRGGVVYLTDAGTALVNCMVVENRLADASGNNNNAYAGIVQKSNAMVVNCVAYRNVPDASFVETYGDVYAGGDANRANWQNFFVNSAWGTAIRSTDSPIAIDPTSFADYANGDYAPATDGPLFNGGSDGQYATYATSATDLAGNARSQGASMDIGCYEVNLSSMSLSVNVDSFGILLGTDSSFTATAAGGSGSYTYKWNFGDGSSEETTAHASVLHTYAAAGLYHAVVSVSDDGGTTWGATVEPWSGIVVAPANLYVDAANANSVFPYDSPAKAAATFADAYGCLTNTLPSTLDMAVVDGVTIHVAAGTYVGAGYGLAGAITVEGSGAGSTVFDGDGGYRVFSLTSSGAVLRNLAVSNGAFTADDDSGSGVYMTAGLVEDCAIASCGGYNHSKTSGGGIYASGGRISRTVFTGCKVHMKWSSNVGYGSALYLSNGAICENSLFRGNAAAPCLPFDSSHYRGGVVHLTGEGTALVNCTVAQNGIADTYGNIAERFAGIVQKSKARVVNCVAYGNIPDAEYATGNGDVCAGGETYRGANWQNYFANSAWATSIPFSNDPGAECPVSPIAIDANVFKNYANGNFAPRTGGVLVDGGTSWADYLGSGALSATDLAGNVRKVGTSLDIGCYEADSLGSVIYFH